MSIYRKDVRHLDELDLYVLADLYEVKSHAVFHAIKKLICAGKRGAKGYEQDLMEAIESIERELQMLPVAETREVGGVQECGFREPYHDAKAFDEQRIDAIGQNGNDGEHYRPAISLYHVLSAAAPNDIADLIVQDGWTPHDGGELCPVREGCKIEILCRNGDQGVTRAQPYGWNHLNLESDIMAYRLA